jgi:hypothetical protein
MQAAATSVALFVTKQYSTVALQFLADTLSNTFWKSNTPDACRLIREEIKHIVPLSEIQVIYALSANCAQLRERSVLIDTLLTNLNEEAAKIHHELHLIRLAILDFQQPWSQRPYYGMFSWFSRSISVTANVDKIKEAAIELRRNFNSVNQWVQTGVLLDSFNRQLTAETKAANESKEKSSNTTLVVEGTCAEEPRLSSPRILYEQQGKWLTPPPSLITGGVQTGEPISSIGSCDPQMIDKMHAITKGPNGLVLN